MNKYLLIGIISAILFLSNSEKAFNQTPFIAYNNTPFRYFVAHDEPDEDWFQPGFNDLSWDMDTGIIGYGDNYENVLISKTAKSLYLRYTFTVTSKATFKEVNFCADYDDGYIVYLNGKEIIRVNISDSINKPAYNDLTIRSHEYESFNQYPVLGYYLDSILLDSCLIEGPNTFAIHVMNDSINGSDLHFRLDVYNVTSQRYNFYSRGSRYKRQYEPDSTNFPLVIINTDEFGIPYKNIRRKAFMGIIDNGLGKFNHPNNVFNGYNGDVSIEVRGQSSSEFPKRSYRFETIDSTETDTNVVLLGMPKENDWILFGPFHDKSQFRNKMIFDMGRRFGRYQPRSEFCELILNGEYLGLYTLTETIKRDKNRINISKLDIDEVSGVDVTGGYIMKYDKPSGNLQFVYPKPVDVQPEQSMYINAYLNEYNAVLNSNNFLDQTVGFRKYICDSSLVDYIIMNEITKNCDAYNISTYFYKDREDKDNRIIYGPFWDYDLAFGNTTFQQGNLTYGWQFEFNRGLNILRILQDENIVQQLQNRWNDLRSGMFHTDSIFSVIDSFVSHIQDPVDRNYIVWPVIGEAIFNPNYISKTYVEEIQNIKNWLTARLSWMDENMDLIYYPVVIYSEITDSNIGTYQINFFPNPFRDRLNISLEVENETILQVEITNLLGQVQHISKQDVYAGYSEIVINDQVVRALPKGIYIIRAFLNDMLICTQKVLKN